MENLITDQENYNKNLSKQDLIIKNKEDEIRLLLNSNTIDKISGKELLLNIYNDVSSLPRN